MLYVYYMHKPAKCCQKNADRLPQQKIVLSAGLTRKKPSYGKIDSLTACRLRKNRVKVSETLILHLKPC